MKALQDEPGISAQNGVSPFFEEIGFNTGAIDTETGEPIGDGNPALQDQKFRHALGWAVDNDQIVKTAFQGAAVAGTTIVPSQYTKWHWEPPDDVKFSFDLDKAADELDAAGYTMGSDGKRTMPDGSPTRHPAALRAQRPEELGRHDGPVPGLARGPRDRLRGHRDGQQRAGRPDPRGQLRRHAVGLVRRARPGRHPRRLHLRPAGGLNDSWYCDEGYDAMYLEQHGEIDQEKRAEIVHQMQEQLYEEAPYLVTAETRTGEAVRNDQFACFQPQPDPDGVWLVQYGVRNYTLLRPADEAGDCDGVTTALGASEAVGREQLRRCRDDADHRRRRAGRPGHRRRDRAAAAPLDGGRARVTRS